MTMPMLANCDHKGSGWCLQCVDELRATIAEKDAEIERMKARVWPPKGLHVVMRKDPTATDCFGSMMDCEIVDVGHADCGLVIDCLELRAELTRLRALCGRADELYSMAFDYGNGRGENNGPLAEKIAQLLAEFEQAAKGEG